MRDSPLNSPRRLHTVCVMSEAVSCATAPCSPYGHQSACLPQTQKNMSKTQLSTVMSTVRVGENGLLHFVSDVALNQTEYQVVTQSQNANLLLLITWLQNQILTSYEHKYKNNLLCHT